MDKSIYKQIIDGINSEGVLDPSFTLPDEKRCSERSNACLLWIRLL